MGFSGSANSSRKDGDKGKTPSLQASPEAAYLKLLGEKQKPIRVKLTDGEVVRGWIEYYDTHMIRLTREAGPNLFIYKHDIVYIAEGPNEGVSNEGVHEEAKR